MGDGSLGGAETKRLKLLNGRCGEAVPVWIRTRRSWFPGCDAEASVSVGDLFKLDGNIAVVTGAGSGIGRGIAEALADAGASVTCADINRETAEETAASLERSFHITAHPFVVDTSDERGVQQLFSSVAASFGRLDILFNSAGVCHHETLPHEFSLEQWNRIVSINLTGVFLCCREALRIMVPQRSGCIVNICSALANRGSEAGTSPGMAATKGGVAALTRDMANAYARMGIRVNALVPGMIKTNIAKTLFPDLSYEQVSEILFAGAMEKIPMARIGTPEDLKAAAVFLASPASAYVTGEFLGVDGGAK
jgi:NAD(P)-dependent dehydrogenase (short-subunit alcohol dehydrogenase family)